MRDVLAPACEDSKFLAGRFEGKGGPLLPHPCSDESRPTNVHSVLYYGTFSTFFIVHGLHSELS